MVWGPLRNVQVEVLINLRLPGGVPVKVMLAADEFGIEEELADPVWENASLATEATNSSNANNLLKNVKFFIAQSFYDK